MKFVAYRLTEKREQAKLTKSELAKILNISKPYLTQLEQGIRKPSTELAFRIADTFGVEVGYFFERKLA